MIALFGEAERGRYHIPTLCKSLTELADMFGNPPENSLGIHLAVQALLFQKELLFFRVQEEGFSVQDYLIGLKFLEKKEISVEAIGLPGVGDFEIIDAIEPVCYIHKSVLITTEKDFYDYITSHKA